jgi:hypothetical protein
MLFGKCSSLKLRIWGLARAIPPLTFVQVTKLDNQLLISSHTHMALVKDNIIILFKKKGIFIPQQRRKAR